MGFGFLYDANGNKSHKRIIGTSAFILGSLIGMFSVVRAIFVPLGDPAFICDFVYGCFGLAAAMGVGSVFEKHRILGMENKQ